MFNHNTDIEKYWARVIIIVSTFTSTTYSGPSLENKSAYPTVLSGELLALAIILNISFA
jgi:hypothetical protein